MRKIFALFLGAVMSLVLFAGCGKNTDAPATDYQAEGEIQGSIKPDEDIATIPQEGKEETTPDVTEEVKEAPSTVVEEPEALTPVEENTDPAEDTLTESDYVIDKYIDDNDFTDFAEYGIEMGATEALVASSVEYNVDFLYDGYFVTIGTNKQDAEYCYIGIGTDKHNTYVCLVSYLDVPCLPLTTDTGTFFPASAAHMLEDTINYMKAHPDPDAKPDIPGMEFESWAELIGG